jgi:hypothetical protein
MASQSARAGRQVACCCGNKIAARQRRRIALAASAAAALLTAGISTTTAQAQETSNPAILEMFESTWQNDAYRSPDIFAAGYGGVWLPPTARADSWNGSAGYDVYDRFDLGSAGNPTLYGTQTGLIDAVQTFHQAGINVYTDLEWNNDGFDGGDTETTTQNAEFAAAGGYPGFVMSTPSAQYGDFHAPDSNAADIYTYQVDGLIDIAQESNNLYVRNPVPGNSQDLPAGTTSYNGRLANVPSSNNYQYYPDQNGPYITVTDPTLGISSLNEFKFNTTDPSAGTPVAENALQYLMRQVQWMIQVIGVDGFRVDSAFNMEPSVLNYFDLATYEQSNRYLLNGQQENIWSFQEVGSSDQSLIQEYVNKTALTNGPGTVGGNRDVLDFPLYWAMYANLTNSSSTNNWNDVVNASIDGNDDGNANNGSQGVSFVSNQDAGEPPPVLVDVGYAYTLLRPGNAIVYYNAQQFFGEYGFRNFPNIGSPSALGGTIGDYETVPIASLSTSNPTNYIGSGDAISTLVTLRNEYGRGNYQQDYLSNNLLAYERQGSCLVLLDNKTSSGHDQETFDTSFPQGDVLEELTGNAANATDNPGSIAPQYLTVGTNGAVTVDFLRNGKPGTSTFTDAGYLIYGLANPQGTLSITGTGTTNDLFNGTEVQNGYGTILVSKVPIVSSGSFTVTLNTIPVYLGSYYDQAADGNNALIEFDGGDNVTGSGLFTTPGSVTYGFGSFTGTNTPGYTSANGYGTYSSSISTTGLSQGYHYIDVRAFRYRPSTGTQAGPAIFTDFDQTVYVDTTPPDSAIDNVVTDSGNTRQVNIVSVDNTANSVHVFFNLPPADTNAQILSMAETGTLVNSSQATQTDVNLFESGSLTNAPNGNNVVTVVTFKPDGNSNVQRFTGINLQSNYGAGLGDLNYDNSFNATDVSEFKTVLDSQGTQFNPAADLNGDGVVNDKDLFLLPSVYPAGSTEQVLAQQMIVQRGDLNGDGVTNAADINTLISHYGSTAWLYDLDASGQPANEQDLLTMVRVIMKDAPGDALLDGKVNLTDLQIVAANWGRTDATWQQGNFTGTGPVGVADLEVVAENYGWTSADNSALPQEVSPIQTVGDPGVAGVGISLDQAALLVGIPLSDLTGTPEPSSLGIVGFAASGLLSRRRRRAAVPSL